VNVLIARLPRIRRYAFGAALLAIGLGGGGVVRLDSARSAPSSGHRGVPLWGPAPAALVTRELQTAANQATTGHAGNWVAAWGAAPQGPTGQNFSLSGFRDQTVRQIVFASASGISVRVRLTNVFGTRPLLVGAATVGVQRAAAALAAGTVRTLTFAGRPEALIPPGAQVLSDPVRLAVQPLMHLAVSLYLPLVTGPATQHWEARQVNYVATGSYAADAAGAPFLTRTRSWYFLDGVDVLAPTRDLGTVVALGDSITDGVTAPLNANARWPDDLARRLAVRSGPTLSVVDEGIGGNRVLTDSLCCGVDAVGRVQRDVLAQPGVRDLILLEGINDIGYSQSRNPLTMPHTNVSALQIVEGYEQIIALAHAAGVRVFGATLTPFQGARYWTPAGEAKRESVNRWIKTSGAFDGVIDFAAAVADPADPQRLAPEYDSGDHLHPSAAGYAAMAQAVNLVRLLGQS
jgi:lysophospholipase L1-like esterase